MCAMSDADHDPAPEAMQDIVGFHLRLAYGAVYRHFTDCFAALGLTQKQVSLLWLVADHPGIAQAELGRRMQMDRATTMGIVSRMEARGALSRRRSASDGRQQVLMLTPAGQAMLGSAKEALRAHEAWIKARYTSREVTSLIELLGRLHG
jgi:DNA-binding MarR family transcriptional regulator